MSNMRFGKEFLFDELEDANMVYYCMILCVGDEARGKGIGTELIRRGYNIAKKVNQIFIFDNLYEPILSILLAHTVKLMQSLDI